MTTLQSYQWLLRISRQSSEPDGFNLYYGSLKGTPHKWLNLERYFTMLRPNDDIQGIRYFTAMVTAAKRPH
jgi:hypothetical protein